MDEKLHLWAQISDLMRLMRVFRHKSDNTEKAFSVDSVREKIWEILRRIHESSSLILSESDAYQVLFALTVHCDEIAHKYFVNAHASSWLSLQHQLYKTTNGGDMFFDYLDSFRGRNDINTLVYEVYFFCLTDGFSGKYMDNLTQLSSYTEDARCRISIPELYNKRATAPKQMQSIRRIPTWLYYAVSGAVVMISHFVLKGAANRYSSHISEYLLGW